MDQPEIMVQLMFSRGIEKSFSTAIDSGYGYLSTQSRGAVYINRYKERQREYLSNF